jgi:hypothetical protein
MVFQASKSAEHILAELAVMLQLENKDWELS